MDQGNEKGLRYAQGLERLSEVDDGAVSGMVEHLGDLGRYIVEFAYGDIYRRGELSARDRELIAVAVLASLGAREAQLEAHLHSAMKVGLSVPQLQEVIIQTVTYAGFPSAINAMQKLSAVVSRQDAREEG